MLWDLAGSIKRSKRLFFETSGDLVKFCRARLSDTQGTNFGQGVQGREPVWGGAGFGRILNLGLGLNKLPVSGRLFVRKGNFEIG